MRALWPAVNSHWKPGPPALALAVAISAATAELPTLPSYNNMADLIPLWRIKRESPDAMALPAKRGYTATELVRWRAIQQLILTLQY